MIRLSNCVVEREVWERAHIDRYLTLLPYEVPFGPSIYLLTLPLVPLDRVDDLDPMSLGYIKAALKPFSGCTVRDIVFETVSNMRDDCIRFYYGQRSALENLWYGGDVWDIDPYTQLQAGRDYWHSRNGSEGFLRHLDIFAVDGPLWDQFHRVAGYDGPYSLYQHKSKLRGHNEP